MGFLQLMWWKCIGVKRENYKFDPGLERVNRLFTCQLKVALSARGNAHSPPSSTSLRKTTTVRYLKGEVKRFLKNVRGNYYAFKANY